MTIEPINSVMTAQAQSLQPVSNNTTNKAAVDNTDVSLAENTPKVDNTTKVVENASEKGDSSYDNKEQQQAMNEQVQKAVEQFNKKVGNSEAIFGIHEGTNRVTIKLVDKETKEVIKELPPEKTLDMIARVWEMAGLLVDERR